MQPLRRLLIAMTGVIVVLTLVVVVQEGPNLLPAFLGPILGLTWQGLFNADFACYLVLSGVWMAWRGGFTRASIALGILAPPLGVLFFAPYLIYLMGQAGGDPKGVLLGVHAPARDTDVG